MRSLLPLRAVLAAACLLLPVCLLAADEADNLIDQLRSVKPEARGSAETRAAWDKLVKLGPGVLPRLLHAMNTPDTAAANWLRTAFDRIVEQEVKQGGKRIDADALAAFARDVRNQGRARRLALE